MKEGEVPPGMIVAIHLEGSETPALDGDGQPLIVQALVSGEGLTKQFYSVPLSRKTRETPKGFVFGHRIAGFGENVRFVQVEDR